MKISVKVLWRKGFCSLQPHAQLVLVDAKALPKYASKPMAMSDLTPLGSWQ
jgi:hypothetical protein